MSRALGLPEALRRAGLVVTEVAGWQERGRADLDADGSVNHHTAGPRSGVQPSLGVCINGRAGLAGPLCNTHGPREESLRVSLVAAGRANHAGEGGWLDLDSNRDVFGHEEEHSGQPDEPLSLLRYDRMVRVHAGFAWLEGFGPDRVCQHLEWAPSRKIDFQRAHVDPSRFRSDVGRRLALMRGQPDPTPPPVDLEEVTVPTILRNPDNGGLWSCDAATMTRHRVSSREAQLLVFYGMARLAVPGKIADAPAELLRMFEVVPADAGE